MKKRIVSLLLTFSILLTAIPLNVFATAAENSDTVADSNILYGDADGNGSVELLDVNLMERYIEGDEQAQAAIHFTEADVNADGALDEVDVQMVKDYLVGNLDSLTPVLRTITFDTDGGGDIEPIMVGNGYTYRGEIPTPAKDNYIFVNWVKEDGSVYYPLNEVISADMTLTAVYQPVDSTEQLTVTSFSLDDQPVDVSFDIVGDFISAEDVKANLTLKPMDGSEPVAIEVLDNGGGAFTVYAPDGFNEGSSYELTLGEGLYFADKEEMYRTAYFVIHKDQVDGLKYNPDMIFIKDTAEMQYIVDGTTVDVLESALLSNDESMDAIVGSFTMTTQQLAVDDIVCIYENTDPRERDYTANDYEDDAMAFVRITGVYGDTYSFESLDEENADKVLATPDSIPYRVDTLPTEDGFVNVNDFDAYARTLMGKTDAPEFKEYDFLIFYTVDFDQVDENTSAAYGQVTGVDGDTVYYELVTKQDIEDFMGMYVSQPVDSETLSEGIDEDAVEQQIEQQAIDSGFAEEAANSMAMTALQTEDVQQRLLAAGVTTAEIQQLSAAPSPSSGSGGRVKYAVESINVDATLFYDRHYEDGVGVELGIGVVLSLSKKISDTATSSLKIELTAALEQEIALDIDVNVEDRWKWYFIVPVLEDLDVTVAIDIEDYTYISVGAKVYTVSSDPSATKKWSALSETVTGPDASDSVRRAIREINKIGTKVKKLRAKGEDVKDLLEQIEGYKEMLPTVEIDGEEYSIEQLEQELGAEDISTAFDEAFNATDESEAKTGMEQLMDRYKEMLEQESDWVQLYNRSLKRIDKYLAIVNIRLELSFVVSANVNIALGADMEYQVGKRYTFWLHILDGKSGSSEIDLVDERFGFQFYVMGALGLKAGIKADISIGLLSVDIASLGANLEFGAYVRFYGYFIYYYEKLRPQGSELWNETDEMMGAIYLELGLYVTVKFKAQVFFNALKYEPTLYNGEFPLLTVGEPENVYAFATEPDSDDVMYVWDEDSNSTNGITMEIADSYLNMKRINLTTGEKNQSVYPYDDFVVTFDDSRFTIDDNGVISVDVPEGERYLTCNMRIVWKGGKVSFSRYDIDLTIPVVWTNMSQSELNEKFTASVAVGNSVDGYQTVWSGRFGRLDVFDLPTDEEILDLIDYDSYADENGTNLKYFSVEGYQGQSTDLSLTNDTTYFFDVTSRIYTLTVTDVQNADGWAGERSYTAKYGEAFDLSDLQSTGTNNDAEDKYTRFLNVTDPNEVDEDEAVVDITSLTVDMAFIEKYGESPEFKANYIDNSLQATYNFVGLGDVPSVTVIFKSGETPYFEGIQDYVKQYGGTNAQIVSVSPEIAPSETSVIYTVVCKIDETEKPSYTLTFDTQGGSEIKAQTYTQGSVIFRPTDPTYEGYTFGGWYADSDCTESFDFTAGMPGANTTVYAKWSANTYTVTFSTTTGTAPQPMDIAYGDTYGTLPELSDANLRFMGWFTQQTGGTQVTADTIFSETSDITLYARWEQKIDIQDSWITITPRTEDYDETEPGFAANISINAPDGDLTVEDFTVTYLWEKAGSEWTEDLPVNAGGYQVKLSFAGDDKYNAYEYTSAGAVSINKIYMSESGADEYLNRPVVDASNWVLTVDTSYCSIKGDGEISYVVTKTNDDYTTEDIGTFYTNTIDIQQYGEGYYTIVVYIAEGTNYYAARANARAININSNGEDGISGMSLAAVVQPASMTLTTFAAPMVMSNFAAPTAMTPRLLTLSADSPTETPTMTLDPQEVYLNRGKEFEVTLALDKTADIWGILAAIDYDPQMLELLGYTYGDIFTEAQFTVCNDLTAVPYRMLATLDEIGTTSAEGSFVTLKFKIREDAEEKETAISLQMLEVVGETAAVDVTTGENVLVAAEGTAPVIGGIEDGQTYCPDQTFTITDANLDTVTVNGEVQTAVDGQYALAADENNQCVIVATDKAGNSVTCTVTVRHIYGEPVFNWSEDGKTCTATFTCENESAHTVTEEATVQSEVKTEAVCTEMGVTLYTATVEFEGHTYTDVKEITDIAEIGHAWSEAVFDWSEDGKTCTATRVCENDSAHVETAEAAVTGEQTKAPSCTEKGETTYTATFTEDWAQTQTMTIADIDAVGHTYGEAWESDETNHWHECACGEKTDVAEHEFVWVTTKEADIGVAGEKHEECEVCGYEKDSVEIPPLTEDAETPCTGDNRHLAIWVAILFVFGGVSATLSIKNIQKKRKS